MRIFKHLMVWLVFGSALWGLHAVAVGAGAADEAGNVSAAVVSGRADARSLFKRNCARCHGADGSADTESGRLYETPDISGGKLRNSASAKLVKIVTEGKQSMPAFGKKLTASEISGLVEYMKSL